MAKESKEGNYAIFRQEALKRFLTFDQEQIISRLNLLHDEKYIYIDYLGKHYRFDRTEPLLQRKKDKDNWEIADANEALTLCDIMCHTAEPIVLSGDFLSLQSLSRIKGGSTGTNLGKGMFHATALEFDQKDALLKIACEALGGVPAGKGDVAYEIPVFEPIHVRFSFYDSDDEFEPQMTILFPSDICNYLHYETLYYLVGTLVERIRDKIFRYT